MKILVRALLVVAVVAIVVGPFLLVGEDRVGTEGSSSWIPSKDRVVGLFREFTMQGKAAAGESIDKMQYQAASLIGDGAADNNAGQADLDRAPDRLTADSGKMYKWQDEQGRWHFSSEKPTSHSVASMEDLPQVQNVMETPVKENSSGSMIGLPGVNVGEILEKVQRMAAERDQ